MNVVAHHAGDDMGLGKVKLLKYAAFECICRTSFTLSLAAACPSKLSVNCIADNAVLCFPGWHVQQWSGKVCAKTSLGNCALSCVAKLPSLVAKAGCDHCSKDTSCSLGERAGDVWPWVPAVPVLRQQSNRQV